MNRLQSLQEVTIELHDLLTKEIGTETRDQTIEKVTGLLNERDHQIQEVVPPYNSTEQETGKELARLDTLIQQHLQELFNAVKTDIRKAKQQKKSNGSYANPYPQTANYDGMFLDHKK